jgi:hypothetical protein
MLEKFSLQIVNERLITIKDTEYRYLVIRKLLKKLRKEETAPKRRKINNKSKDSHSRASNLSESESEAALELVEGEGEGESFKRRRLDNSIMEFYIECLCRYKNEKRVYYEFVCYMLDYLDNIEALIAIIVPFQFESCLGLLEQTRQNYFEA